MLTFATATLIYCPYGSGGGDGPSETEHVTGFHWLVPLLGVSLVTALTLDYDSFVLTRTVELRKRGFSHRMSICKAVSGTGGVVTFAAAIMAVAFGSLILSPVLMLQQFGCVVAAAVLADAFLVRALLVPALMAVAPGAVWWPRRFPSRRDIDGTPN